MNKSFQSYYESKFGTYIEKAMESDSLQTKSGNPKIPSYSTVSKWVLDWIESTSSNMIKSSFEKCVLLDRENYEKDKLHDPLKHILQNDFDKEAWQKAYGDLLESDYYNLEEITDLHTNYYTPDTPEHSLFKCFHRFMKESVPNQRQLKVFIDQFLSSILEDPSVEGLFDAEDAHLIRNGKEYPAHEFIFGAANMLNRSIEYTIIDENNKILMQQTFRISNADQVIFIVQFDNMFSIRF